MEHQVSLGTPLELSQSIMDDLCQESRRDFAPEFTRIVAKPFELTDDGYETVLQSNTKRGMVYQRIIISRECIAACKDIFSMVTLVDDYLIDGIKQMKVLALR